MNTKVIGTLVSMAILSTIVYIFALFSIPFAHASEIMSEKVAIEDGSLRSLSIEYSVPNEDDNISNVVVKEDSIAVNYKEQARIFGIIPTEMTVTVTAHNDSTVIVDYPWYAFLAGKNKGSLKSGLQARISQILKSAQI